MTDKEKAIVMAHTGICMLKGDKFQIFHKYVEDLLERPVMTHEIGWLEGEIKEKSKADFIALCADDQVPCGDYISRNWLKTAIHNFYKGLNHIPTEEDIQAYIDAAPPEDCIRRSDIDLTDLEVLMCNGDYKEALKMLLDKIEKTPPVTPHKANMKNLDDIRA